MPVLTCIAFSAPTLLPVGAYLRMVTFHHSCTVLVFFRRTPLHFLGNFGGVWLLTPSLHTGCFWVVRGLVFLSSAHLCTLPSAIFSLAFRFVLLPIGGFFLWLFLPVQRCWLSGGLVFYATNLVDRLEVQYFCLLDSLRFNGLGPLLFLFSICFGTCPIPFALCLLWHCTLVFDCRCLFKTRVGILLSEN